MKKTITKTLACLLSLLTIAAVFPLAVISQAADWDETAFGSYPQTKVTDESLIASLNELAGTDSWTAYDYYYGDGSSSSVTAGEYTFYKDVTDTVSGKMYRGVYFTQYRPQTTYGAFQSDETKTNQYKNGYYKSTGAQRNVYWFEYEPVVWQVIDADTGFMMSKYILDCGAFNIRHEEGYVNFEESSVYTLLNSGFAGTAFSGREKAALSGDVRLLTPSIVTNTEYGFPSSNDGIFPDRMATATDYTLALGQARNSTINNYSGNSYWLDGEGYGMDGAAISNDANVVMGYFGSSGSNSQNCNLSGIRPVIKLKNGGTLPGSVTYYTTPDGSQTHIDYYYPGEPITAFTPDAVKGYTFNGWKGVIPEKMPLNDLEYSGNWIQNNYTLTLDAAGGKFKSNGSDKVIQDHHYADELTEEIPEYTGYVFNGWDGVFPETMPDGNLTLTAQWANADDTPYKLNIYKQNADDNGYELTQTTRYGTTGSTAQYTADAPEHFVLDESKSTLSAPIQADGSTELSVYYDRETFMVTFDFADGKTESISGVYKYGQAITPPDVPAREGFTSTGWTAPATCEGEATYTLVWTALEYTITFNTAGGSAIPSKTYAFGAQIEKPADPVKNGYVFTGWSPAIPDTMPAGNVTVTATYRKAPSVSIAGYQSSRTIGYKVSVTFHANVSADNYEKLVWIVDGREYTDDGSLSYKVASPKAGYSVQCRLVTADGQAASEKESVTVQNNFFAKIIYIFRLIFVKSRLNIDQR